MTILKETDKLCNCKRCKEKPTLYYTTYEWNRRIQYPSAPVGQCFMDFYMKCDICGMRTKKHQSCLEATNDWNEFQIKARKKVEK